MNRVAVVTGASQGIGKAVAQNLLREGYSVVLTSRRKDELKKVVDEVKEYEENALVYVVDVSDPESVSSLFQATLEKFGRIDFLFNNAGFAPTAIPIEDIPYSDWKSTLETNVTGTFLCTQEAFRIMKSQSPQGGRIINNGSVSAQSPRENFTSYTASKHAVTGLTKSTALEGRDYNIACGQIDFGNVSTQMTEKHGKSESRVSLESASKMVIKMADLPIEENVLFMTMLATQMPFIGRG